GTLPHAVFEEPTTVAGNIKPEIVRLAPRNRGRKSFTTSGRIENELGTGATTHSTKGVQLVAKAGIQRRHDLLPTQQQPVEMVTLGNRFMNPRPGVNVVPFEDGDSIKVVGEDPRGHQSRQAATDDHRLLTKTMCHKNSPQIVACGSTPSLQRGG